MTLIHRYLRSLLSKFCNQIGRENEIQSSQVFLPAIFLYSLLFILQFFFSFCVLLVHHLIRLIRPKNVHSLDDETLKRAFNYSKFLQPENKNTNDSIKKKEKRFPQLANLLAKIELKFFPATTTRENFERFN